MRIEDVDVPNRVGKGCDAPKQDFTYPRPSRFQPSPSKNRNIWLHLDNSDIFCSVMMCCTAVSGVCSQFLFEVPASSPLPVPLPSLLPFFLLRPSLLRRNFGRQKRSGEERRRGERVEAGRQAGGRETTLFAVNRRAKTIERPTLSDT